MDEHDELEAELRGDVEGKRTRDYRTRYASLSTHSNHVCAL